MRVCLLIVAGSAAVFVARYQSDRPWLAGWSWKYLAAVVAPLAGLALAILLVRAGWIQAAGRRLQSAGKRWSPTGSSAVHPAIFPLILALVVMAGIMLGNFCPEPHGAIALPILAAGLALILGSLWFRTAKTLLAGLAVLAPAAVIFLAELPHLLWGPPEVHWGQPDCFAGEPFPERPPFIGPGGRLHPHLDGWMAAPEYPRGARILTDGSGFRRREGTAAKTAAEPGEEVLRVLSLGDSFAAGFCADQDHYFGSLLERNLAASAAAATAATAAGKKPVEVLTAEVSDPAYGLYYLQHHGLALRPQVVLYGLCGNDVMQAHWYAGPGRRFLLQEGILKANPDFAGDPVSFYEHYQGLAYRRAGPGPTAGSARRGWLASLARFRLLAFLAGPAANLPHPAVATRGFAEDYQKDGRLRLLDGAANLGFYLEPEPPEIAAMYETFAALLGAMDASCRAAGARFVLVLFPQRQQVQEADWAAMRSAWNLDDADFDLERPQRVIGEICRREGIACVDLLGDFRRAASAGQLYLPAGDVHFNRRGHACAAGGVAERLADLMSAPPGADPAFRTGF